MKALLRTLLPAILLAAPALAGPPYQSDDPEPTDLHHWEVYVFNTGTHVPGLSQGEGGLDLNYGGFKDVQLTLVLPLAWADGAVGAGAVEAAVKWKFVRQDEHGWRPAIAFFPRLFLPSAGARFGGSGQVGALIPLWFEKDLGKWSIFGGGGYAYNPGAGNRDNVQGGVAVTRQLTKSLNLGLEIYHHTRDHSGGGAFTGANAGLAWKFSKHWSLLASGGPGIENARSGGQYAFYTALKADY